jgi:hypothetical protein
MDSVVLSIECGGNVNVRVYYAQAGQDSAR